MHCCSLISLRLLTIGSQNSGLNTVFNLGIIGTYYNITDLEPGQVPLHQNFVIKVHPLTSEFTITGTTGITPSQPFCAATNLIDSSWIELHNLKHIELRGLNAGKTIIGLLSNESTTSRLPMYHTDTLW